MSRPACAPAALSLVERARQNFVIRALWIAQSLAQAINQAVNLVRFPEVNPLRGPCAVSRYAAYRGADFG